MSKENMNKPQQEEKKKKKGVAFWWTNLGMAAKTTICILGGVALVAAVTIPTIIAAKSCSSEKKKDKTVGVNTEEVTLTHELKDGNIKAIIKSNDPSKKEIEKVEVKIGDYQLKDDEYTYDSTTGEITIKKEILDKHDGNVLILVTLKDIIQPKSISIPETMNIYEATSDKLVVTFDPEETTYKDVTWEIDDPSIVKIIGNRIEALKINSTTKIRAKTKDGKLVSNDCTISVPNQKILTITKIEGTDTCKVAYNGPINDKKVDIYVPEYVELEGETLKVVEIEKGDLKTPIFGWCCRECFIPKSVIKLADELFYISVTPLCYLEKVTFEEGINLEILPNNCFNKCQKLTEIKLPNSIKKIDYNCFRDCFSIKEIKIPDSVEEIGENCFCNCKILEKIDIGESSNLKKIGKGTFSYCVELKEMYFPKTLETIDTSFPIFAACNKLNKITIDKENPNFASYDATITNKEGNKIVVATQTTKLNSNITTIGKCSFYYVSFDKLELNKELTTIEDSGFESLSCPILDFSKCADLSSIGSRGFFGNKELTTIIWPENSKITSIPYYCFAYCSSLTNISFKKGITNFGGGVFSYCTNLETVDLSELESVPNLGDNAFDKCSKLTTIKVKSTLVDSFKSATNWSSFADKIVSA